MYLNDLLLRIEDKELRDSVEEVLIPHSQLIMGEVLGQGKHEAG